MKKEGRAKREAQSVKYLLCMKIRIQIANTHTKSHVWPCPSPGSLVKGELLGLASSKFSVKP